MKWFTQRKLDTCTLMGIWNRFVLPKVTYKIHLVTVTPKLTQAWKGMEKAILATTLGCFSEKYRAHLRVIGRK